MPAKHESIAEGLRNSKESSGDSQEINDVPGVRQTGGVLEKDASENPVGQSPTNFSRHGSGTHDYGKSAEDIADRRARGSRVDG